MIEDTGIRRVVSDFIDKIDDFSDGKLTNKEDIIVLISLAAEKRKQKEFLELIFFAKFVIKLYRIMKKGASKAEEQDKVKQEFKTHTEKVKEILREIVSADENIFMVYNGKYLNNTPESSGRLLDLLNDLAWIKNWHLDKKTLW